MRVEFDQVKATTRGCVNRKEKTRFGRSSSTGMRGRRLQARAVYCISRLMPSLICKGGASRRESGARERGPRNRPPRGKERYLVVSEGDAVHAGMFLAVRTSEGYRREENARSLLVLVDGVPASSELHEKRCFVKRRIETGGVLGLCLAYHFLRMIFSLLYRKDGRNQF